jgi:hypothetical protein
LTDRLIDERDLGAMLKLAPILGFLKYFDLKAGLFAGNGIAKETNGNKNFIGHLGFRVQYKF